MGRLRLRQGPSQLRLAGRFSWLSSTLGLVLGLGLLFAAQGAQAAISLSADGKTLTYTARTGDQNVVSVTQAGDTYTVTDAVPIDDGDGDAGCAVSGNTATCATSTLQLISINTLDLNDQVTIDPAITVPAQIFGRAGDDQLNGGGGNDVLNGGIGDDSLTGNGGTDTADYSSSPSGGINVNLTNGGATGAAGTDTISSVENVQGSAGADTINVRGGGSNRVGCGPGSDLVVSDASDVAAADCEHVDNGVAPVTQITSGPPAYSAGDKNVIFEFSSSKPNSAFECLLGGVSDTSCTSPKDYGLLVAGDYTFEVTATDEFGNKGNTVQYPFTIDQTPPTTAIDAGPEGTTSDSTPTFMFSSSEPVLTFECQIDDGVFQACGSPFEIATPLANGDHSFTVAARDLAGNVDQTPPTRLFKVDAPATPPPPPSSGPPAATTSNTVIFGSLVLISGRSVKLVKGKLVPVILTCSGTRKCEGRLTITSDRPVKKSKKHKSKRLERLGSTRFSIQGNGKARVMVGLSKSKVRLIKKLHQLKARATIREVDVRGNPRISMRAFVLRYR